MPSDAPLARVPGAGSGIGRASALALGKRGVALAVVDLDEGSARETASQIPGAKAYRADVSVAGEVEAAVGAAVGSVHRVNGGAPEIMIASQRFTYPTVNVAAALLLALAAVGAAVIAIALRAGWRQLRDYRRFVRGMAVLGPLPGHPGISVIDDPAIVPPSVV